MKVSFCVYAFRDRRSGLSASDQQDTWNLQAPLILLWFPGQELLVWGPLAQAGESETSTLNGTDVVL